MSRRLAGATMLSLVAVIGALAPSAASAAPFKFGMQANNTLLVAQDPLSVEAAVADLDAAGVQVARITLGWQFVATNTPACLASTTAQLANPGNACYNWALYDTIIGKARQHGIEILASIYLVPGWVTNNSDPAYMGATDAQFNHVKVHYAAFAQAVATRYQPFSAIGPIQYVTLGNEPNSFHFWRPQGANVPQRYAQLYVAGAKAFRQVNGAAKLAPGPTGPKGRSEGVGMVPQKFIRATVPVMASLGAGPFIDAWAHNPYPGSSLGPRVGQRGNGIIRANNIDELFSTLDAFKITRKKPVWATEFSYQTNPPTFAGVSPVKQAQYLGETFELLETSKRVTMGFWYVYRDNGVPDDWQSGIVDKLGKKKPSYEMYLRPVSATARQRVGRSFLTRTAVDLRRGESVNLWGASLTGMGVPKLAISFNGRAFKAVKSKRRGSAVTASVRATRTFWVRVQDSGGNGPSRKVIVR